MNAIEMAGIDTLKFIIFPRIMGMVISMILLLVYFTAVGLIGGFVVGNLLGGVTFDMFMRFVMTSISFADIIASLVKGVVFGFFISAISIYYGFQAISPTQVPQVTTQAVMSSIFATFFLDIIITVIFYIR
jgi:phospholipid/cholesterol/gamma-HCH transport system permease protein